MSAENVASLARVAGVSVGWLASGYGSPDEVPAPPERDPYGTRRIAIAAARNEGLASERVISQVQQLNGETFRTWPAPRWAQLIDKLSLYELRTEPQQFFRLMERVRASAESAPAEPIDAILRRAIGDGT